ncbi:uncharacterized protein LOC117579073 [Drosophila guanche]|uniref:Uncharacterized protein n=1 Tax=Drosophila guanche TaxID=7266 RepID=A0A3B0J4J7_DROGU|nr:uncharacterized protein LOC117579073 [Drosophila guanche]SPP76435.1 Hypothetical predicted protein [Drosophila guanche]
MPMARRCVICGMEPLHEVDAKGNEKYTYPKTQQEARIWQQSMGAQDVCVESIQHHCCVCVEHIPDFVRRSKRISRKQRVSERAEDVRRRKKREADTDGCECPDQDPPQCPAVNVLLINGASLPSYCGKGQSCVEIKEEPGENDGGVAGPAPRRSAPKLYNPDDSDTEIFVQESLFEDIGASFPDIDETEVTVLRTPVQEDEKIEKIRQRSSTDVKGRKRNGDCAVCMPGCTDVLVLGRGAHPTDACPCKCEQCTKQPTVGLQETDEDCCNPPCCPDTQEHYEQPPCGCECEQQVRRVLGKVIKTQKQRIKELESMLCKQNNLHTTLQRKVDELYCEFGRLDEDDTVRLACCASGRGPPDCGTSPHQRSRDPRLPRRPEHLTTKDSLPDEIPPGEEIDLEPQEQPEPRVRVKNEKSSTKNPEQTEKPEQKEKPTKPRKHGWLCFKSSETDKGSEKES